MSTIDKRIVDMEFNNGLFEKNASQTIATLNDLSDSLDFDDASKGILNLNKVASGFDMSPISVGLDAINDQFDHWSIFVKRKIQDVMDSVADMGISLMKSMSSFSGIIPGFNMYEQHVQAVKTVMNATDKSAEEVEGYLEKLVFFSDETSYNFTDMVNAIASFTAAGVDLEVAADSMQGIAAASALAGANSNQATSAYESFARAIGRGSMRIREWDTMRQSGLTNNIHFKNHLLETAAEMGKVIEMNGQLYTSQQNLAKGEAINIANMRSFLVDDWMDTELMLKVFTDYGEYANAVYEIVEDTGKSAIEAMKMVDSLIDSGELEINTLSKAGFQAAQEARTWTDTIQAVQQAVAGRWRDSIKLIVGDTEEATELFTNIVEGLWGIFVDPGDARNELLYEWRYGNSQIDGREVLIRGLTRAVNALGNILGPIKDAWDNVFPAITADRLTALTVKFSLLMKKFEQATSKYIEPLRTAFTGIFGILKIGIETVKTVINIIWALSEPFRNISHNTSLFTGILTTLGNILIWSQGKVQAFLDAINTDIKNKTGIFSSDSWLMKSLTAMSSLIKTLTDLFAGMWNTLKTSLSNSSGVLTETWGKVTNLFINIRDGIAKVFYDIFVGAEGFVRDMIEKFSLFKEGANDSLGEGFQKVIAGKDSILMTLGGAFNYVIDQIQGFYDVLKDWYVSTKPIENLGNFFGGLFLWLSDAGSWVWEKLKWVGSFIKEAFSNIKEGISILFGGGDFNTAAAIVNSGMLATLALVLKRLYDSFKKLDFGRITAVGDTLRGFLDSLKNSLNDFVAAVKLTALKKVATSILLLSIALLVLSFIKPEKLLSATLAIGALFTFLGGFLVAINKWVDVKELAKLSSLTTSLAILSLGVIALALAVKTLSKLDFGEMMQGLLGVGLLLGGLVATMRLMPSEAKLAGMGATFLALGISIRILVSSVKSLGKLDDDALGKGLVGVLSLMVGLGLVIQLLPKESDVAKMTGTFVAIGVALLLLSASVKSLGKLDDDALGKGLVGVLSLMVGIGLVILILPKESDVAKMTGTFIAIGAALLLLSASVKILGNIDESKLTQGLLAITGMLIVMSVLLSFMTLMEGDITRGAIAIAILSASLLLLTVPLAVLSLLPWQGLATATLIILGLVGAMAVIAKLTQNIDASNLVVIAAAIALIGIALGAIGFGIKQAAMGIILLSGAFAAAGVSIGAVVVTLVGTVIAAISTFIAGIARIFNDLRVEITSILTNMGLIAMEALPVIGAVIRAFLLEVAQIIVESGPAIISALGTLVISFIQTLRDIIPELMLLLYDIFTAIPKLLIEVWPEIQLAIETLGLGILETIQTLFPEVVETGVLFMMSLFEGVQKVVPEFLETAKIVVFSVMDFIESVFPRFVKMGINLIISLLDGISSRIGDIVDSAVTLIVNFVAGITDNIYRIIDSAFKLIIGFINGLADAIRDNDRELFEAAGNIIGALVEALLTGIGMLIDVGGDLLGGIWDGIIEHGPGFFKGLLDFAGDLINTVIDGIGGGLKWLWEAAKGIPGAIWDGILGIGSGIGEFFGDLFGFGEDTVEAVEQGMDSKTGEVKTAGEYVVTAGYEGVAATVKKYEPSLETLGVNLATPLEKGTYSKSKDLNSSGIDLVEEFYDGADNKRAALQTGLNQIGTTMGDYVDTGTKTKKKDLNKSGSVLVEEFFGGSTNKRNQLQSSLQQIGTSMGDYIDKGATGKKSTVKTTGADTVYAYYTGSNDEKNRLSMSFVGIGEQMVNGITAGINNRKPTVTSTARSVVNTINTTMRSTAQISSPSRITTYFGEMIGDGLAGGMLGSVRTVIKAAKELASSGASGLGSIVDLVMDLFDDIDDSDLSPVITPIVDMSNVDFALSSINGRHLQLATSAGSLSASINRRQEERNQPPVYEKTEVTFEKGVIFHVREEADIRRISEELAEQIERGKRG